MTNEERARRFRIARTELSPHGTETQAQVYTATKVSASAISNLENPENARMPSADMVNTLAEYYGVNAAWLTGQSESWSLNKDSQALTKVLGFSPRAADKLTDMMGNPACREAINGLIESDRFDRMIHAITRLTDMPQPAPEGSWNAETVDYADVVRKYAGKDSSLAFDLAESDIRDLYTWKAEREMEGLIRDVIGGTEKRG